jgi:hypothetical protein
MHSTAEAKTPEGISVPVAIEPTAEVSATPVTPEPEPVSPMGFSALAGMIGLAGGMVLAPWLEHWFQRTVKETEEESNG